MAQSQQTTTPITRSQSNPSSRDSKKDRRKDDERKRGQSKKSRDDTLTCGTCQRMYVDAEDKLLQCERCNMWKCNACLKYSDAEYNILNARPELHWYCDDCQQPAIHAVQSDKEVEERCKYYMAQFTQRIETLELEVEKKASKTEVAMINKKIEELEKNTHEGSAAKANAEMEEKFAEFRRDQAEIEKRRSNLIIYAVEEQRNTDAEDGRRADEAWVRQTLNKLKLPEVETRAVLRLGNITQGRNRPIKVILNTESDKVKVMNRMSDLRQSERQEDVDLARYIQISADLSLKQRTEHRALVQLMERRKHQGEEDLVIRGGRITKRKPFRVRRGREAGNN